MPTLRPITRFRGHPIRYLGHYVARHGLAHAVILTSVVVAVFASVFTQYGLKRLIDVISAGVTAPDAASAAWSAFALLCGLIAADNLTWRIGGRLCRMRRP